MSVRVGASHSLPSKCLFRASKYSPNSRGLKDYLVSHLADI